MKRLVIIPWLLALIIGATEGGSAANRRSFFLMAWRVMACHRTQGEVHRGYALPDRFGDQDLHHEPARPVGRRGILDACRAACAVRSPARQPSAECRCHDSGGTGGFYERRSI